MPTSFQIDVMPFWSSSRNSVSFSMVCSSTGTVMRGLIMHELPVSMLPTSPNVSAKIEIGGSPDSAGPGSTRLRRIWIIAPLVSLWIMSSRAFSVLSAVEGLGVATHAFDKLIVPITVVILIALFAIQKRGTGSIGRVFGPIMVAWFATLAALGVLAIIKYPRVLAAVSPTYAVEFFMANGKTGFTVLGSVVLCITGSEALYADMGHFGPFPIRLAWFCLVLPALLINYFGQGALLLVRGSAATQPFFMMAPQWALLPLVALSTAAAIIASQALISGAFSLTRQAIQLGYAPRLDIQHTSSMSMGIAHLDFEEPSKPRGESSSPAGLPTPYPRGSKTCPAA